MRQMILNAVLDGESGCLCARGEMELAQDRTDIIAHRFLAEKDVRCYLTVRLPFCNQRQDLHLLLAQVCKGVPFGAARVRVS